MFLWNVDMYRRVYTAPKSRSSSSSSVSLQYGSFWKDMCQPITRKTRPVVELTKRWWVLLSLGLLVYELVWLYCLNYRASTGGVNGHNLLQDAIPTYEIGTEENHENFENARKFICAFKLKVANNYSQDWRRTFHKSEFRAGDTYTYLP
jgi:hypothetical protein